MRALTVESRPTPDGVPVHLVPYRSVTWCRGPGHTLADLQAFVSGTKAFPGTAAVGLEYRDQDGRSLDAPLLAAATVVYVSLPAGTGG